MAYSDPRTWVTGELVTAALMNAQLRDNLDAVIEGTTGAYVNAVVGPHAIGGSTVDYVRLGLTGAFTSGGASTVAFGTYTSGVLTGHSADSAAIAGVKLNNSIVTAGNCTTIAQLWVSEPQITVGAGAVTNSATVYIESSASEATNDYALWVDAGATKLDGTLDVTGATTLDSTLGVVGAVTFNDAGADVDFRVESDDNQNMIFVDGGEDRVGIGTGSPQVDLHIDNPNAPGVLISRINTGGAFTDGSDLGYLRWGGQDSDSNLEPNAANITADVAGTWTSSSHPTELQFSTTAASSVDTTLALTLTSAQNATFAGSIGMNGETAAANQLDDYEEGTWSPVPNGSTGSAGTAADNLAGSYTKVGRLVVATCYGYFTNLGSWTGDAQITGWPFTHGSGTASYGSIGQFPSTLVDAAMRTAVFPAGGTMVNFRKGSKLDVVVPFSAWTTGSGLAVTISYYA